MTIVIPEVLRTRSDWEILLHPSMARMKASLLQVSGVQVLNIPIVREEIRPDVDEAHEPARNIAVVLVSGVHNATLQAIEFAESLRPTDIRGLSFGMDPEETEALGNEWLAAGIPHALEIEDAPFRDIGPALVNYLRQYRADGVERVITVVIPEFVVSKKRHQILHNQTALVIKRRLLFETGVAVASVPYHLEEKVSEGSAS